MELKALRRSTCTMTSSLCFPDATPSLCVPRAPPRWEPSITGNGVQTASCKHLAAKRRDVSATTMGRTPPLGFTTAMSPAAVSSFIHSLERLLFASALKNEARASRRRERPSVWMALGSQWDAMLVSNFVALLVVRGRRSAEFCKLLTKSGCELRQGPCAELPATSRGWRCPLHLRRFAAIVLNSFRGTPPGCQTCRRS